jgi:4-hydroxybenzoate polyprenyltransferase
MANGPVPPYQPEQSHKDFQAERAHKDYQASIETGRAATQAAILISGGAATAILTFLSKQVPPPPEVVNGASWSLLFYTVGVACGALSMWSSAYSLASDGSKWEKDFFNRTKDEKDQTKDEKDQQVAPGKRWLSSHRVFMWLSFLSFMVASFVIATAFLTYGIIKQPHCTSACAATNRELSSGREAGGWTA